MAAGKLSSTMLAGLLLATGVMLISCAGIGKPSQSLIQNKTVTSDTDYSGIYEITDSSVCSLTITIIKKYDEYIYTIDAAGVKSSGILFVEKEGGEVYFNFAATRHNEGETSVTGIYSGNSITIQNYGNAMNSYTCFEKCDAKYLNLVRKE